MHVRHGICIVMHGQGEVSISLYGISLQVIVAVKQKFKLAKPNLVAQKAKNMRFRNTLTETTGQSLFCFPWRRAVCHWHFGYKKQCN